MMKRYLFLACILSVLLHVDAEASSLFGRVIEVNSGDVITVFNLNRPVRVRLLGVDAPEMTQPFGDVAKKHLSDLVLDKLVLVEYSGISADSSLTGRVLLDSRDVGAQMIRDGAAWFDLNNFNRLSATDREVYQQSEQAARNERRGLWQTENPVAPWEFVKSEAAPKSPVNSLKSTSPDLAAKPKRPTPELTNLTLMPSVAISKGNQSSLFAERGVVWREWKPFHPEGEDFSVLVPEDGRRMTVQIPLGEQLVDFHHYMATNGLAVYSLMWVTAPAWEGDDKEAIRGSIGNLTTTLSNFFEERNGFSVSCTPANEKDISLRGYAGLEFDILSCKVPAKVRAYTRMVGDQRTMYVAVVFSREEDGGIARFMRSFKIVSSSRSSQTNKSTQ